MLFKPELEYKLRSFEGLTAKQTRKASQEEKDWNENFINIVKSYFEEKNLSLKENRVKCYITSRGYFTHNQDNLGEQGGCGRYWNSAKAMVIFVFSVDNQKLIMERQYLGQSCVHCVDSPYQLPLFHERTIKRILRSLLVMVLKKMFDIVDESLDEDKEDTVYRHGGAHNRQICEACKKGICGQKKVVVKDLSAKLNKLSINKK
ncbi:receptor-transporting protein 4-like [Hydractinia symbiolongicarpus]|uniref:receptor-transporting protein 4-like n=1 Tax=Hydractinia symbiolongicarpus TaxID=13093 RepID=UPI00254D04BA|nr:receptor-transporting protein 4-like [Hydractinia symbiolongicarpus]